ncbi:MAG: hypothetical protein M1831_000531 [Alyxoria varia]|nr:MAG: hypothetical protein M1831_000531 [Alyxoria varia]
MDRVKELVKPRHPYTLHARASFEGYYTKFPLPSGASLILIIFTIPAAASRGSKTAHSVEITYVPADYGLRDDGKQVWQQGFKLRSMEGETWRANRDDRLSFRLETECDDVVHALISGHADSTVEYRVSAPPSGHRTSPDDADKSEPQIQFTAQTQLQSPWSQRTASPEGLWSRLPFLPLHWHVHSLSSTAEVNLKLPTEAHIDPRDTIGTSTHVHEEKNWATSFPSAHMWVQAREGILGSERGICLAGGRTLGVDAYLLGYRNESKDIELDFRPPFTVQAPLVGSTNIAPFMSCVRDWENRRFVLSVQDFTHRVVVRASAPKGTFFPLCAPFKDGARENWLAQSLSAEVEVEIWRRKRWVFGPWILILRDVFGKGSLEFGGEYYPKRGTEVTRN